MPVGIDGRTAPKLPKLVLMRVPFGSLETPASTGFPLASRRLPSAELNPAGSALNVGRVPPNGEAVGQWGSYHYVNSLSASQLHKIFAAVNLNSLGAPNYVRFVTSGAMTFMICARHAMRTRSE